MQKARPLDEIPIEELEAYKVWEFDLDEEGYAPEQDETWVKPVCRLPVTSLDNRLIVTRLTLANDIQLIGMLDNIDLKAVQSTREFIGLSIEKDGEWFHLARYFDAEYPRCGPNALADFLGLPIEQVFPIRYDISDVAEGADEVVRGEVHAEPTERLSDEERMSLALGD